RPALAGDYILFFEPHDDPTAMQYNSVNRAFAWQPDALRLGAIGVQGSADFTLLAYPSRIAFTAHVIDVSTVQQWFGAWYNRPLGTENPKIFISAAYTPPGPTQFALKEQSSTQERFCPNLALGPSVFAPGDSYTVVTDTNLVTGGDHLI